MATGPAAPSEPIELGGVNVFTAEAPVVATVRISARAKVAGSALTPIESAEGFNPDIRIYGRGRVVGFYLRKEDGNRDSPSLFFANEARCSSAGCGPGPSVVHSIMSSGLKSVGKNLVLSPGVYRLYLIADAAPMRVVLQLHGLEGRARIAPTQRAKVQFESPTVHLSEDNTKMVYSTGDTAMLDDRGFVYESLILEGQYWGAGEYGDCIYSGPPPLPEEVAYQACLPPPFSHTGWTQSVYRPLLSPYFEGIQGLLYLDRGDWSYGQWYRVAADVTNVMSHVLWLTFDD